MANLKTFTFILCIVAMSACGGRIPSPKTAQSISRSYFRNYGQKYKESVFGNKNLDSVTINAIEEISHNTVYVDTIVLLKDGNAARTLLKMEKHFPMGWKVASWEFLDSNPNQ